MLSTPRDPPSRLNADLTLSSQAGRSNDHEHQRKWVAGTVGNVEQTRRQTLTHRGSRQSDSRDGGGAHQDIPAGADPSQHESQVSIHLPCQDARKLNNIQVRGRASASPSRARAARRSIARAARSGATPSAGDWPRTGQSVPGHHGGRRSGRAGSRSSPTRPARRPARPAGTYASARAAWRDRTARPASQSIRVWPAASSGPQR